MDLEANLIVDSLDEINLKLHDHLKSYTNLRMGYCFFDKRGDLNITDFFDHRTPQISRENLKLNQNRSAFNAISCLNLKTNFFKILLHIGYEMATFNEYEAPSIELLTYKKFKFVNIPVKSTAYRTNESHQRSLKSVNGPSINKLTDFFEEGYFKSLIASSLPRFLINWPLYNLKRLNNKIDLSKNGISKNDIFHFLNLALKSFKRFDMSQVCFQKDSTDDLKFQLGNIKTTNLNATRNWVDVTSVSTLYEVNDSTLFSHDNYWLENLHDLSVCRNVLDIFSTTKVFADKFNSKYPDVCKINAAETFLLTNEKMFLLMKKVNQTISNSELKFSNEFPILVAFSHFTFIESKGHLVIFDLRSFYEKGWGIWNCHKILLTEPVIFSKSEKRFSSSNLGQKGLDRFEKEHKCNYICDKIFKLN